MKITVFFLFLFFNDLSYSQCAGVTNLIPNPSFENFGACHTTAPGVPAGTCRNPNELYQDMSQVTSWFGIEHSTSCTVGSTPDFGKISSATLPACAATLATSNNPCFGSYTVGYFAFSGGVNTREYVQCQLVSTLIAGQTYCFSAVVKSRAGAAGNEICNTNGFGAYFHNLGLINIDTQNGGQQYLGPGSLVNGFPQVQASGNIPHNVCTTVTGTFVATGTEQFLTLGNFRDDAGTTKSTGASSSYIYIDDLKLFPITPLAVNVFDYAAKCEKDNVKIFWSSNYENKNDFYSIESSCDGLYFNEIVKIKGQENSNYQINYEFVDEHPCLNKTFYNLYQTDLNGNKRLIETVFTECKSDDWFIAFPNPATDFLTIQSTEKLSEVFLTSLDGKLIKDFTNQINGKEDSFLLDISDVVSGVYFLDVFDYSRTKHNTIKLIIY